MAVDQTPIQAIYDRLNQAMSFHPGSTEIFDDFLQEAGDVVTMISDNVNFDFPIFSQHMKWNGSMLTTLESTGNEIRNELPPLQRRSKNGSYGAGQRITEQGVIYQTEITKTNKVVGMGASAIGVKLDANGNPMIDPNNPNEFIWDDTNPNGAKVFSKLTLTPNRAQLLAGINGNASENTMIKGAIVDLSAQGTVLIQAINAQDPTQTSIRLQAAQINLDGYVTASQLDARLIDVDKLFVDTGYGGTIYVNSVRAGGLWGSTLHLSSGEESYINYSEKVFYLGNQQQSMSFLGNGSTASFTVPNAITELQIVPPQAGSDIYTLQGRSFNSPSQWSDIGTFSRATSLNGAWSGGTYTVTATPQGETESTTIVVSGDGWDYDTNLSRYYNTVRVKNDGGNITRASVDILLPTITLSAGNFNAQHKATVHAYGPSYEGSTYSVATALEVNASGVYTEGYTDGKDENEGISALGLSSAYDTQPSADEDKGELTANKYYKVTAVPVSGTGKSFSFKTPAGGGSGGISSMTVGSGSTSEPTADYGGDTLTCNRWFVVTATPNSGQSATFKFKTGSPVIDINPQEWRDSGQAAPSGAGNAKALNITGSYITKGKLGTCYFYVTAGASHKWYKIPVDTR